MELVEVIEHYDTVGKAHRIICKLLKTLNLLTQAKSDLLASFNACIDFSFVNNKNI